MSFRIRRHRSRSNWDRIPVHLTLAEVMADLEAGSASSPEQLVETAR